jgi:hypothetical protein
MRHKSRSVRPEEAYIDLANYVPGLRRLRNGPVERLPRPTRAQSEAWRRGYAANMKPEDETSPRPRGNVVEF